MVKENRSVKKLGVTGGIGSGKTTVCRVFNVLGIPVFDADTEARNIMNNDRNVMQRINSIVGKDLYTTGKLDRISLADLLFNNKVLLAKVNSLVHPIVYDHFNCWEKDQNSAYVILEAAILFESGGSKLLDRVISVVTPVEERIERIIRRNFFSREQILERIKNQMDDDSRIRLSDYVIYNSDNEMIIPAILKIHKEILTLNNIYN